MKALILAGGLGTRLAEETTLKPKPMVEIGGHPILWHIMKIYASHGIREFVVALGYRGGDIVDFFSKYFQRSSSATRVHLASGKVETFEPDAPDWIVDLVDTGQDTMTGGRLRRLRDYLPGTFCMTYGDGVSDVNVTELIAYHRKHGKLATVTAAYPPSRFGALEIDDGQVIGFAEKPKQPHQGVERRSTGLINAGFFVLEPNVIDFIADDATPFETTPMERLTADRQLMAYRHHGFWQPMDTIRERDHLRRLWDAGNAPWTHNWK
jgi:glucose-1-phosphate cytidylyltransferase